MDLKKRLTITFITLTFLPIIITFITFIFLCGIVLINEKNVDVLKNLSLDSLSEITELTEDKYYEISAQIEIDAQRFTNEEYLDELNEQLKADSSYIVARRGDEFGFLPESSAAVRSTRQKNLPISITITPVLSSGAS